MSAKKETNSNLPKSISVNDSEIIAKITTLKGDKTNNEFMLELITAYETLHGLNCSEELTNYFPNIPAKERQDKEGKLRDIFGLSAGDSINVNESELLEKAKDFSGKSIEEMTLEGRVLVAKNEIGRQVQYMQGKGKKGMADDRIKETYELMQQMGHKITLNRLTAGSGSNRKTVESWCERNNIELE